MSWVFWIVAAALLLWAEMHTQALYAFFLSAGAAAAAIAAVAGGELLTDLVVFVIVSALGILALRPFAIKRFQSPSLSLPGVHGGIEGQTALTVDSIGDENHLGHVQFAGEKWLAYTDTGATLSAEQKVIIVSVQGTKLLVRPAAS